MTTGAAPGVFITFEGGEGAGKSTQIRLLATRLRDAGHDVVETREPGGSTGAEAVRHAILSGAAEPFGIRMEAILFAAARNDHVEELIRPAMTAGRIVLCDRFIDSTRVYQGVTGNLEKTLVNALERVSVNGMMPHLTVLLDVPAELGLRRALARGKDTDVPDRFEREDLATHESRRQAFADLAAAEPARFRIFDGSEPAELLSTKIGDAALAVIDDLQATGNGVDGTGDKT